MILICRTCTWWPDGLASCYCQTLARRTVLYSLVRRSDASITNHIHSIRSACPWTVEERHARNQNIKAIIIWDPCPRYWVVHRKLFVIPSHFDISRASIWRNWNLQNRTLYLRFESGKSLSRINCEKWCNHLELLLPVWWAVVLRLAHFRVLVNLLKESVMFLRNIRGKSKFGLSR
jgi:hypothetical protein